MRSHKSWFRLLAGLLVTMLLFSAAPPAAMAAGVTVYGTVKNEQQVPIAGVAIEAIDPATGQVVASAQTNASGYYSLLLNPHTYDLRAVPPEGSPYSPSLTQNKAITADTLLDFVLVNKQAMATLSGRLLTPLGKPITGMKMWMQSTAGSQVSVTTVTDAEGRYSLTVPPGNYRLQARQDDIDWTRADLPLNFEFRADFTLTESRVQDLVMPLKRVSLLVTDTAGNPVPGAVITTDAYGVDLNPAQFGATYAVGFSHYSLYFNQVHKLVTDEAGRATLWVFPMPSWLFNLTVTPPEGANLAKGGLRTDITGDTSLTLVLSPAVTLSGRMLNSLGEPMAGQEIGFSGKAWTTVRTDADGRYSAQLEPGDYYIYLRRANGDNGANTVSTHIPEQWEIRAGQFAVRESRTWDFHIPFRQVNVNVRDSAGNPMSNATLRTFWWVTHRGNINDVAMPATAFGYPDRSAMSITKYESTYIKTDAAGNATLWLLPRPTTGLPYSISARPAAGSPLTGGSVTTWAQTDESLTIVMQPSVTLSGKLQSPHGDTVADQTVAVFGPNGNATTTTNAAGEYAVNVAPGAYGFQVSGNKAVTGAPYNYTAWAYSTQVDGNRTFDITLPEYRADVKVQDPAGAPIPGVKLSMPYSPEFPIPRQGFDASTEAAFRWGQFYSSYTPAVTDSQGEATMWLFDTSLTQMTYSITATPPANLPFLPVSMTNLKMNSDRELVIVLQFNHDAPVTTATVAGEQNEEGAYTGPATVTMTAVPGQGYQLENTYYQVNGGPVQTYTGPVTFTEPGTYTVAYWSKDTTGVTELPKSLTLTIVAAQKDTTPPVITPSGTFAVDTTTVLLTCTDDQSGVDKVEYSLDGGATWLLYQEGGFPVANGTGLVSYRCTDRAGNMASGEITFPQVQAADHLSDEGLTKEFVLGAFADGPDGPWSVDVTWGDGSEPTHFTTEAVGALGTQAHMYRDNGVYPVTVKVTDKDGWVGLATFSVTVANAAPSVGPVTGPAEPVGPGMAVDITAPFTDPGVLDTHTAVIDWGDGIRSAGVVTEADGSGTVSGGTHSYALPGSYTVRVTVTDKDGGKGEAFYSSIVVYASNGGFLTGGGWFESPQGAYAADPALTGRVNLGFEARYQKGANLPSGQVEVQFQGGKLNFHSTGFDWLVASGAKAQLKGSGTIDGQGDYGFLLTVVDGRTDTFRIKIWEKQTGNLVYDSQMGAADMAEPATAIRGHIEIHK